MSIAGAAYVVSTAVVTGRSSEARRQGRAQTAFSVLCRSPQADCEDQLTASDIGGVMAGFCPLCPPPGPYRGPAPNDSCTALVQCDGHRRVFLSFFFPFAAPSFCNRGACAVEPLAAADHRCHRYSNPCPSLFLSIHACPAEEVVAAGAGGKGAEAANEAQALKALQEQVAGLEKEAESAEEAYTSYKSMRPMMWAQAQGTPQEVAAAREQLTNVERQAEEAMKQKKQALEQQRSALTRMKRESAGGVE